MQWWKRVKSQKKTRELAPILAHEYPEVFAQEINAQAIKHTVKHYAVTKGPPVTSRLHRLSPEKRKFLQEKIKNLFKSGHHKTIFLTLCKPHPHRTKSRPEEVSHGRRLPGTK